MVGSEHQYNVHAPGLSDQLRKHIRAMFDSFMNDDGIPEFSPSTESAVQSEVGRWTRDIADFVISNGKLVPDDEPNSTNTRYHHVLGRESKQGWIMIDVWGQPDENHACLVALHAANQEPVRYVTISRRPDGRGVAIAWNGPDSVILDPETLQETVIRYGLQDAVHPPVPAAEPSSDQASDRLNAPEKNMAGNPARSGVNPAVSGGRLLPDFLSLTEGIHAEIDELERQYHPYQLTICQSGRFPPAVSETSHHSAPHRRKVYKPGSHHHSRSPETGASSPPPVDTAPNPVPDRSDKSTATLSVPAEAQVFDPDTLGFPETEEGGSIPFGYIMSAMTSIQSYNYPERQKVLIAGIGFDNRYRETILVPGRGLLEYTVWNGSHTGYSLLEISSLHAPVTTIIDTETQPVYEKGRQIIRFFILHTNTIPPYECRAALRTDSNVDPGIAQESGQPSFRRLRRAECLKVSDLYQKYQRGTYKFR